MSKAFKKLTGLLLAVLMVVTMIPVMGGRAAAADPVTQVELCVNGVQTGVFVTREWMAEHSLSTAQVFPFPSGKGKDWNYVVAKGPAYAAVLSQLTGAQTLDDLVHAKIRWCNASGVEEGSFDLPISGLMKANTCFKLLDQNGDLIVKGFQEKENDPVTSAHAVEISGASEITPIIALEEATFKAYEEYTDENSEVVPGAIDALSNNTWKDAASYGTDLRPYIGGDLTNETQNYLKKDGKIEMGVFNFVGKFSMSNLPQINLKFEVDPASSTMTFTNKTPQKVAFNYDLTDVEKDLLMRTVTWSSSNNSVATVDQNGQVTPAGKAGSSTVTATAKIKATVKIGVNEQGKDIMGIEEKTAEIGSCAVTVTNEAVTPETVTPTETVTAPTKPVGFKVKNVKKRSAKLTWKKTANANGYIIYRSTKKNKGFKKIKTIKKGSTTKFINKKLKKRKTYYYKIKAYRTVQGKKLYSPLTSAKKVKIKK